jgi:hypothetical protein
MELYGGSSQGGGFSKEWPEELCSLEEQGLFSLGYRWSLKELLMDVVVDRV